MSNATSITINDLTADALTQVAGDVLDTGTVAVTLYGSVPNTRSGDVLLYVDNGATVNLTVTALAGDNPPAFRAGLGNVSGTVSGGSVGVFGPFETARFMQNDNTVGFTFTPASGSVSATIRAYQLPIV